VIGREVDGERDRITFDTLAEERKQSTSIRNFESSGATGNNNGRGNRLMREAMSRQAALGLVAHLSTATDASSSSSSSSSSIGTVSSSRRRPDDGTTTSSSSSSSSSEYQLHKGRVGSGRVDGPSSSLERANQVSRLAYGKHERSWSTAVRVSNGAVATTSCVMNIISC
jgi:hypothetical protein